MTIRIFPLRAGRRQRLGRLCDARARLLAVLASLAVLGGCVSETSPVTGEKQYYGYSWEQELELGQQADQQISQQFGIYEDEELQAYVEGVAQQVLATSDFRDPDTHERYRSTDFTFRVLNSPVVNAFALPGGYVYVTRGLLTHLQNEAQLAVVLGHEIAHVAARHASRQALRAQFSQLGLVAGAIIGQEVLGVPGAAENILNLGGAGLQLLLTKYGRDAEREADELGVRYAAGQGYEVAEGAGFFRSLERLSEDRGSIPSWQSTHPDPGERAQRMIELGREWQSRQPLDKVQQQEFMRHLEGVVVGEDPREGYVADQSFFHPELEFRFSVPVGWELINQPTAVVMADPNRQALITLSMAPGESAREAAGKLAQTQGLQVVNSGATTINGLDAYEVAALAPTQRGQVALVNYFIEYGGNVYSFLGYGPQASFGAVQRTVIDTLRSFERLTDRSRLSVEPTRLEVVRAPRRAPFRSFVGNDLPEGFSAEKLAVLNQVELDEMIEAGRPLKLIR